MSKKDKQNGQSAATTTNGNEGSDEQASGDTPVEKKEPDVNKLKALFATYAKDEAAVEAAEKSLAAAVAKKSATVKAISDEGGSGPYAYKGDQLTISNRGSSYFFRGRSKTGAIQID